MRMWLATVQGRKRANPWTECECRLKEGWKWGSTCECRHVSTTDVPWEWRWWREGMAVGVWESKGAEAGDGVVEAVGSG